jgi:hypothetical protein
MKISQNYYRGGEAPPIGAVLRCASNRARGYGRVVKVEKTLIPRSSGPSRPGYWVWTEKFKDRPEGELILFRWSWWVMVAWTRSLDTQ